MKDAKKYKWFYTSSGKLVVGGKSGKQNDELLVKLKKFGKEYYVMHTSSPGSPFCVIDAEVSKVTKKDLAECAVFTGCFSRAWRQGKKKAEIHVFKLSQLKKLKSMNIGMWGVQGSVKKNVVELKLILTKQKSVYRAVPEKSAKKKLLKICPGKVDKVRMIGKLKEALEDKKVKEDELLGALPAGGVAICK
jgi:hypothetical protein